MGFLVKNRTINFSLYSKSKSVLRLNLSRLFIFRLNECSFECHLPVLTFPIGLGHPEGTRE